MIFCGARKGLLAAALLAAVSVSPAAGAKSKALEKEDLINVLLSPGLAQWLVGPISRLANDDEIEAYLAISNDVEASAFIEKFWQDRVDPANPWPGRRVQDTFDRRAESADRLFTEGASVGRRTDRGTLYILYGAPNKSGFVKDERARGELVEVWIYDQARRGLDGSHPERRYYFVKRDGVTVATDQAPKVLSRRP